MCITRERHHDIGRWNWEGDYVVHECIVPSNRRAIGSTRHYDIDVREFLLTERNEVMRRTIREDLRRHVACMPDGDWGRFEARARGSFDYRVRVIADFVAERIAYPRERHEPKQPERAGNADPWQFPDETLVIGTGDCEDRALLTASLLLAAGISSFHVRVALGQMVFGAEERRDHVWVMYKTEDGRWTVVDPPPAADRAPPPGARRATAQEPPTYEPHFLFNDVHLWAVRRPGRSEGLRAWLVRAWQRLEPAFHGKVHRTILEEALVGADADVRAELESRFHRPVFGIFGPLVDEIDRLEPYEPAWHFDSGYIEEGWRHVEQHLSAFHHDRCVRSFAIAAHGIADFYAHSNFCHLAEQEWGAVVRPYDRRQGPLGGLRKPPDYTRGDLHLDGIRYSWNGVRLNGKKFVDGVASWQGQLISGRYGMSGEPPGHLVHHWFLEGSQEVPQHLQDAPDFWRRRILPHHDEIAVDDAKPGHRHCLYRDRDRYRRQFRLRQQAAVVHIRQAFAGR